MEQLTEEPDFLMYVITYDGAYVFQYKQEIWGN